MTDTASAQVRFTSHLSASADTVWDRVTTFEGVNSELRPLMRMTTPKDWTSLTPDRIRLGERLFRSWLLLFGLFPVDYDDLTIVAMGPGYRFLERSRMLSATVWQHERTVVAESSTTCRVTDQVSWVPRWKPLGLVLQWFVPVLFTHRHRRLRAWFNSSDEVDLD